MNRHRIVLAILAMAVAGSITWSCEETPRGGTVDGDVDGDTDGDADGDTDGDADRDTDIREEICDGDGNCYCLRLAVIGTSDSAANETDVSAFVEWLNTKSSCKVTMYEDRVALTEAFLAEYDILLFQLLADTVDGPFWTYSQDEVAALRTWVEAGGGMITLTGYNGNRSTEEVAAINGVLEPVSGISYNNDQYLSQCVPDTDGKSLCYCWGNTVPVYGWNRNHEISTNISQVGMMWGYSINAPDGAVVVAEEAGKNAAVAMEIGAGRVFAFADEWVIFSNQWRDSSTNPNPGGEPNQYNDCYDMDKQQYNNAENYFQIPQFWYNVIKWVAPPNDCFVIDDPGVIV